MPTAREIGIEVARALRAPEPTYDGAPDASWPREELVKRALREAEEMNAAENLRAKAWGQWWTDKQEAESGDSPESKALAAKLVKEMKEAGL